MKFYENDPDAEYSSVNPVLLSVRNGSNDGGQTGLEV